MARTQRQPIAKWSPARDVWETEQACICGHSDVFSETFPNSGMTVAGTAYELPTSAHRTDGSGSSSSLPTPRATRGGSHTETVALLPSPAAYDGERGGPQSPEKRREGGHQPTLQDVATHL